MYSYKTKANSFGGNILAYAWPMTKMANNVNYHVIVSYLFIHPFYP